MVVMIIWNVSPSVAGKGPVLDKIILREVSYTGLLPDTYKLRRERAGNARNVFPATDFKGNC